MTMRPTVEKKSKIEEVVKNMATNNKVNIREFSKFIGTLISVCPATKYGWLYTKKN